MVSPFNVAVEATVQPLVAPFRLTSDLRLDFRRAVLDVDLSRTIEVDASGLGVLVLLQKRARERGIRTRLLNTPRSVVDMLSMTRLDTLFELGHS
jgi:anti-anti-sigma factor